MQKKEKKKINQRNRFFFSKPCERFFSEILFAEAVRSRESVEIFKCGWIEEPEGELQVSKRSKNRSVCLPNNAIGTCTGNDFVSNGNGIDIVGLEVNPFFHYAVDIEVAEKTFARNRKYRIFLSSFSADHIDKHRVFVVSENARIAFNYHGSFLSPSLWKLQQQKINQNSARKNQNNQK